MIHEAFLLFNSIPNYFKFLLDKNQLIYLGDLKKKEANSWVDVPVVKDRIESGDILKIDVKTTIPEASTPYNVLNVVIRTI